jgi:hypothetical protein
MGPGLSLGLPLLGRALDPTRWLGKRRRLLPPTDRHHRFDTVAQRELFEKTTAMLGYDDYLMASDKVMVRVDENGKYKALSLAEYYDAKKAGRITPGDNGIENLDYIAPPREKTQRSASEVALDNVKALILADKVEGVVFQGPKGMNAFAIQKGTDSVVKLAFDKLWKREAIFNLCEKRGVPNNLKDVLAAQ